MDFNSKEYLIPLSSYNIDVFPMLYDSEIEGAYKNCYVRRTVANMLLRIKNDLPDNLKLVVLDGYRSRKTHLDYCEKTEIEHLKDETKYSTGGVVTVMLVPSDCSTKSLKDVVDNIDTIDVDLIKEIFESHGFMQAVANLHYEFEFGTKDWASKNNCESYYDVIDDIEYSDRVVREEG